MILLKITYLNKATLYMLIKNISSLLISMTVDNFNCTYKHFGYTTNGEYIMYSKVLG